MSKTRFLIDADVLVYQAAAGAEKIVCWDEDVCLPICNLSDAIAAFDFKLNFIMETLGEGRPILCFSDDAANNFRRRLMPEYKSNRAGKPKPVALRELRHYIMQNYNDCVSMYGLEADDVMGIMATEGKGDTIVVSIDKDLKSIPGKFFNIGKPDEGVQTISETEADMWFMKQALMGDATDGYAGCPKYGPATAEKLIANCEVQTIEAVWPWVVRAYEKAGFGEDYAILMARMARILRAEDYDMKKQEVRLWTPKH